jgi:hypothetical protein
MLLVAFESRVAARGLYLQAVLFRGSRSDQELLEFRLESLSVGAIVVCHFAQSTMRRACSTS